MKTTPMKTFLRPQVADYVRCQASKRQLSVSATIDALLYESMQGSAPAGKVPSKPLDAEARKAADDTEAARQLLERMFDK